MLVLLASILLVAGWPGVSQTAFAIPDTVKSAGRDTVSRQPSDVIRTRPIVLRYPSSARGTILDNLPVGRPDPQHLADIVDSVLRRHPELRQELLKEFRIPSRTDLPVAPQSRLEAFNRNLREESEFTPFERMSLIAKRYAVNHPNDTSLKSHQLDIIGTILWLSEILQ